MNNESCKTCRFWECIGPGEVHELGACRRIPPVVHPARDDIDDTLATFPCVYEFSWCGEYQAAEQHVAPKCSQCGESLCANGFLRRAKPFIFAMPCNCCGFENRLREADLEKFCTCKHHNSEPLCYYCKVRTNGIH